MLLGEGVHESEPAALDERIGDWPAGVGLESGLVVEQLELAGASGHEEVDDAPRPGGEVTRADRQGIGVRAGMLRRARARRIGAGAWRSGSRPTGAQQRPE